MDKKDKALYQELQKRKTEMCQEWFDTRPHINGSIYSSTVAADIEQELREQYMVTLETVASGMSDDPSAFMQNVKQWANIVVHSRLEWNVPLYEVNDALNRTRNLVWSYIHDYCLENEAITKEDVLRWSERYHPAIDTMIATMSKAYYELTRDQLQGQEKLIEEIDSPVIRVAQTIGILPLIGTLDEKRAESLNEQIPIKCIKMNIEHLVIDLSGMHTVDTFMANRLFQLIQALQLLGIETALSSIRPEVAQTAVLLGLDFRNIRTYHGLPEALVHLGFMN